MTRMPVQRASNFYRPTFYASTNMTAGEAGDLSRYSDQATGWTVRGSMSGRAEGYSLLRNVQTGFGAHPTSD